MFRRVHHINFVVRDLDVAAARFGRLLDQAPGAVERLPARGVELIRFRLGEAWLVLVHPTDPECVPGRYLAEHGEGFFLLSCEVEDISECAREIEARGFRPVQEEPRGGLDDWRVIDLDPADLFGINFQLVEPGEPPKRR